MHIRPTDTVLGSASGKDPQLVNIDCTGLGGHDLGGFKDYDICLRTDKQSVNLWPFSYSAGISRPGWDTSGDIDCSRRLPSHA